MSLDRYLKTEHGKHFRGANATSAHVSYLFSSEQRQYFRLYHAYSCISLLHRYGESQYDCPWVLTSWRNEKSRWFHLSLALTLGAEAERRGLCNHRLGVKSDCQWPKVRRIIIIDLLLCICYCNMLGPLTSFSKWYFKYIDRKIKIHVFEDLFWLLAYIDRYVGQNLPKS